MSPRTKAQFEQIRQDRKEEILSAALTIFAQQGYHSASISSIAKHAGISKGLMYNYFESKRDLLEMLLEDLFESIVTIMAIDNTAAVTNEVLTTHIHKTFEIIDGNRDYWKLYFSMISQDEVMEISKQKMLPKAQTFLAGVINYFAERGAKDPVATMRYFMAVMDGAKMQYLFDPDNFPIEKVKIMIIDQFTKNEIC